MKLVDDFRNPELAKSLIKSIKSEASPEREYVFMEICGSHTMAVSKWGIRSVLPDNVRLISGPGCPVCVTAQNEIDALISLAERDDVVIATFGDLLKVPGSSKQSLSSMKSDGADVRIVFSPLDSLKIAKETEKNVVFAGIGFETTAPAIAGLAKTAYEMNIDNLFITPGNKTMPEVLDAVLSDENLKLDGFLCPGHVTVITGLSLYDPVVESEKAAVITGFEPVDILASVLEMVRHVNTGHFEIKNMYGRVVKDEGNPKARALLDEVYEKVDAYWRGIGLIEKSGLAFRDKYKKFDAFRKFNVKLGEMKEIKGCRCGDVLKGYITPKDCPLFGNGCSPEMPVGPCMVSGEGACSAYFKYEAY